MPRFKSFDIETTGLEPYRGNHIFSYCIGDWNGGVDVYRLDNKSERRNKRNRRILKNFFEDTSIEKIAHNYKYELSFLIQDKINVPKDTIWHDTMIMSQLLRNRAPSHSLESLCWELAGYPKELDAKVRELGKAYGGYHKVPEPIMNAYQIADGERPMLLFRTWYEEFQANKKLWNDYRVEIDLVPVIQRLEQHGMMVDFKNAERLIDWLNNELDVVRDEAYKIFKEYINFGSDPQVARILYNVLGLPIFHRSAKTGEPSTDKHVLMELQEEGYNHPVINLIMKYRSYTKGLAMVNSYIDLSDRKGVLRPTINPNIAKTGRMSSKAPNMHNVSKEQSLLNPFPVPARQCFKAFPDSILYLGDYAGQELRLIVELSGDEAMKKVLESGGDMHGVGAEEWYGDRFKQLDISDPEWYLLRTAGKNMTFAIAYGAGIDKIARGLGISLEEAEESIARYSLRFPKIVDFSSMMSEQARGQGFVETPFGRKLYVDPDKIYSAGNYIIQGTAAGMLKRAMIAVDKYLISEWGDLVRLLLPVHDELMLNNSRKVLKYESEILSNVSYHMTNMPELKVPMEVEWKRSTSTWAKAKSIILKAA